MTRPKVCLIAPPFSGHLHPLLGIGEGLRSVAEVTVLSTPGAATSCRLPFHPILAHQEKEVWAIAEPGKDVKSNPLLLYRQLKANISLLGGLKRELKAYLETAKPDLVIADFTVPVAGIVAQELGIRWWTSLASPCVFETPDGPPAYCGGLTPATTLAQRLLQGALRQATRLFKKGMCLLFRRELRAIGFPSLYRSDGSEAVYSPQRILALGIAEIEFPRTYPAHFQFVGPALHTPPDSTPPPVFRNDGRPCVLVTLGTHLPHAKAALRDTVAALAAKHPAIEFHFTHGSKGAAFGTHELANFQEFTHVSYAEHLPRYSLVVHHAGAGIYNHCLRHGIPSVVIPQDYDQFDNAARLAAHGLAVRATTLKDLEPALLSALQDAELRKRCAAMRAIHERQNAADVVAQMVASL